MRMLNRLERVGPSDLTELVTDIGPVPMNVGALIYLDGNSDPSSWEAVFIQRVVAIRRLRQRLVEPPWGLGRPYWVDDADFDISAHVSRVRCPDPGDSRAALEIAVDAVTRPLPRSRPLWRAIVLTDIANSHGHSALVMVLHHVLADGIGGLAILARLTDGTTGAEVANENNTVSVEPRPMELLVDSAAERLRTLRRFPQAMAGLRGGWTELGHSSCRPAPQCSLNAATGPRRMVRTVEVGLDDVRDGRRRQRATVNDVLLVAAAGALEALLHLRNEYPEDLTISVPVAARSTTTSGQLGNQVGVMPIRVPLVWSPAERLACVAATTKKQKMKTRGSSATLIGPLFRLLVAIRVFRWFVNRQRLVNSFLSNLPGPSSPLTIAGAPITSMVPVTVTAGNVGVAFAAVSYAGTLTVAIIVDPDIVPEIDYLADALHKQFQLIIEHGGEAAER